MKRCHDCNRVLNDSEAYSLLIGTYLPQRVGKIWLCEEHFIERSNAEEDSDINQIDP